MKTYLITGCAGFIGSNFVHYMLKKYPEILLVNLDKLTYAGNLENLKDVEGKFLGSEYREGNVPRNCGRHRCGYDEKNGTDGCLPGRTIYGNRS